MKHTKKYKLLDIACIISLVFTASFIIIKWDSIPDIIPTHYGVNGADSYGSKTSIWFAYVIAVICYVVLKIVFLIPPEKWNMPVKITDKNRDKAISLTYEMIQAFQLESIWIVLYIVLCQGANVEPNMLFIILSSIFVPMLTLVFYMIRFSFMRKD